MIFRKWTCLSACIVLTCVATALLFPESADAGFSPCSRKHASNWHVGPWTEHLSGIFGAEAIIEANNPDLCGSNSWSVVWTMVTANNTNHPTNSDDYYAQVGYGDFGKDSQTGSQGFHIFSQYTRSCIGDSGCATEGTVTKFGVTPVNDYNYSVFQELNGDRLIGMYANGVLIDETGYDPSNYWDTAWSAQWQGETLHEESDIVGTASDVTNIRDIYKLDGNLDAHAPGNPYSQDDSCRYHWQSYTPTDGSFAVQVWTSPLSGYGSGDC